LANSALARLNSSSFIGLGRWIKQKKLSKKIAHYPSGRKTMNKIQPKKFITVMAKIGNSTCTFNVPVVAKHLTS
jgi:hypothetical protein